MPASAGSRDAQRALGAQPQPTTAEAGAEGVRPAGTEAVVWALAQGLQPGIVQK